MSDMHDKLERLHDSRRRAESRPDDSEQEGGGRGDGTREYDDRSELEDDDSEDARGEPARGDEDDGYVLGEAAESTPFGPAPYLEHRYALDERYGDIDLIAARAVDVGSVFESLAASDLPPPVSPDVLYLDTETTGLSSDDFAFCVGLGDWHEGEFRVRHYVFDALDGEKAMLAAVASWVERADLLCTFNGDRFDVPLLERRYDHRELASPFGSILHIDLLKVARRIRPELESHSLDSMETHALSLEREDDLPGEDVPDRWERFRETGRAEVLEDVFEHNRYDILALAGLMRVAERHASSDADDSEPIGTDVSDASHATEDDASAATGEVAPAEPSGDNRSHLGGRDVSSRLARARRLQEEGGPTTESALSGGSLRGGPARDDGDGSESPTETSEGSADGERVERNSDPAESGATRSERLKRLRREAMRRIDDEGLEAALPLLHEIAALAPQHAFALEKLAAYHRRHGSDALAEHYDERLRDVSSF
jgi:uncharacterized protein YprB with RNaseH-like and TPR domain